MMLQHTRIAVQLVVEDDSGQVVAFLTVLTTLLGILLKVGTPVYHFVTDWAAAITFTAKVWSIWFNAFAYGVLGLRL